jgi:hypothetical protein
LALGLYGGDLPEGGKKPRGESQPAIHLASGAILSRMRSTGFAGASAARVLDRIDSASPIMLAVGWMAKSDIDRWIKSRRLHLRGSSGRPRQA